MNKLLLYIVFLFILVLCIFSCIDNKYIVEDLRNNNRTAYIVYFMPRIESNITTRTLTPFPQYCEAQIFAFSSGGAQQSAASPVFRSSEAGTLSPVNIPMRLMTGEYDFYAISTKQDSIPVDFYNNIATGLSNGIDYLWASVKNQIIDSNGTTVPITFQHVASQIVIYVANTDSVDPMTSIQSARYNEPYITDDISWNLLTGEITTCTEISSTQIAMDIVNDTTISAIMVPVDDDKKTISCVIVIVQNSGRVQSCAINLPNITNGYQAGHCYEYLMYFDADSLELGLVKVAPWNDVVVSDDVTSN